LAVVALLPALLPFAGFWIVALIGSAMVLLPVGAIVVRWPKSFGVKGFVRRHGFV
jgi:hypothetical protein